MRGIRTTYTAQDSQPHFDLYTTQKQRAVPNELEGTVMIRLADLSPRQLATRNFSLTERADGTNAEPHPDALRVEVVHAWQCRDGVASIERSAADGTVRGIDIAVGTACMPHAYALCTRT